MKAAGLAAAAITAGVLLAFFKDDEMEQPYK
jgi:hypothetical protein